MLYHDGPIRVTDDVDKVNVSVANLSNGQSVRVRVARHAQKISELRTLHYVSFQSILIKSTEARWHLTFASAVDVLSICSVCSMTVTQKSRYIEEAHFSSVPHGHCPLDDSSLGDDPRDEVAGSHVEGGVPRLDSLRSDALTEDCGELSLGALLDVDAASVGGVRVEGGGGCGDEEGDAVVLRGDGELEGAHFVRGVSVGGDAISADDDGIYASGGHQVRRHGVGDESAGQAVLHDLEGRQTSALVVGPRLAGEHVFQTSEGVQRSNHAQSGAVAGRCQAARVADGEDPHGLPRTKLKNSRGTEISDGDVGGDVLAEHGLGGLDVPGEQAVRRGTLFRAQSPDQGSESIRRLEQVDRGGPRSAQVLQRLEQEATGLLLGAEAVKLAVRLRR